MGLGRRPTLRRADAALRATDRDTRWLDVASDVPDTRAAAKPAATRAGTFPEARGLKSSAGSLANIWRAEHDFLPGLTAVAAALRRGRKDVRIFDEFSCTIAGIKSKDFVLFAP